MSSVTIGLPLSCLHTVICVGRMNKSSISSRVIPILEIKPSVHCISQVKGEGERGGWLLTFRFGNTEESPNTHQHDKSSKHEESSVPETGDHIGCRAADDERPEPGASRRQGDAEHSDVQRENLRCVSPSGTLPGRADDESIHVDAHHGEVPPAALLNNTFDRMGLRIRDLAKAAHVEQGQAGQRSAVDEGLAAAEPLDHPQREEDHPRGLDDTVDSRAE